MYTYIIPTTSTFTLSYFTSNFVNFHCSFLDAFSIRRTRWTARSWCACTALSCGVSARSSNPRRCCVFTSAPSGTSRWCTKTTVRCNIVHGHCVVCCWTLDSLFFTKYHLSLAAQLFEMEEKDLMRDLKDLPRNRFANCLLNCICSGSTYLVLISDCLSQCGA